MLENPKGPTEIESVVIDAEVRLLARYQHFGSLTAHRYAPLTPIPALCSISRRSAIALARTSTCPPSRLGCRSSACASSSLLCCIREADKPRSDLMHLNGRSLLSEPFRERRRLLHETLPPYSPADASAARWDHVKSLIGSAADLAPIRDFMAEAISNRCAFAGLPFLSVGIAHARAQVKD